MMALRDDSLRFPFLGCLGEGPSRYRAWVQPERKLKINKIGMIRGSSAETAGLMVEDIINLPFTIKTHQGEEVEIPELATLIAFLLAGEAQEWALEIQRGSQILFFKIVQ